MEENQENSLSLSLSQSLNISEPAKDPAIDEPSKQSPKASKAPSMAAEATKKEDENPSEQKISEPSKHPAIDKPSKQSPEASKAPSMAVEPTKTEDQNPSEKNPESTRDGKKPQSNSKKKRGRKDRAILKQTNSFSLKLSPAVKLKHAIEALSDAEFNQQGTAMIEVEKNAVELTVRNTEKKVVGYLRLEVKGLVEFEFRKPLRRKMINLNHITQYLDMASDKDTVTIYHVEDSNELSFSYGTKITVKFGVTLLDMFAEFEKVPDIIFACECVLLNEALWELLERVEGSTAKLVSMELSDSAVTFFVGLNRMHHDYSAMKGGIRGMERGQCHHAVFQWHHCETLRKASLLTKGVLVCIVTCPQESIMWRFNLRELGDLAFIRETTMFTPNFQSGGPTFLPISFGGDSTSAAAAGGGNNHNQSEKFEVLIPLGKLASTVHSR